MFPLNSSSRLALCEGITKGQGDVQDALRHAVQTVLVPLQSYSTWFEVPPHHLCRLIDQDITSVRAGSRSFVSTVTLL